MSSETKTNGMSVVSRKYDVEDKGFLTEEQQMLRNLDSKGTGQLTPEQLAPLMNSYKELMKENAKNSRLIKILFAVVVVLGVGTIVASVLAANYAKDTSVSSDGALVKKGSDQAVITTSQGVSVSTVEAADPTTGEYFQCIAFEHAADLWVSFKRGTPARISINETLSVGQGVDDGEISYGIMDIGGGKASINETHTTIGDIVLDTRADNPCNRILLENYEEREGGDNRELFMRHIAAANDNGNKVRRLGVFMCYVRWWD